jgi:thiol:disulfide interchange protein
MKPFPFSNLLALFFIVTAFAGGIKIAQAAPPQAATATAKLSKSTLRPGERAVVTIYLNIKNGYHANANPASAKYLVPVTVTVSGDGVSVAKPIYPKGTPKKFSFSDQILSVYEGQVAIKVAVRPSAKAKTGDHLNVKVRYQACNDRSCLIPQTLSLSVPYYIFGTSVTALTDQTVDKVEMARGAPTGAPDTGVPDAKVLLADAVTLQKKYQVVGLPTMIFLDGNGKERQDLRADESLTEPLMLQKMTALTQNTSLQQNSGSTGSWLEKIQNAPLALQLLLIFIGGLLLNLTPCVFPMIPVTVGYFGGQSEGRAGKTFILACFYVLGLAIVYSALGVVAALTGSLFGSTLQSPWLLAAMAIIFLILGASMFGLFVINPPSFILQQNSAKKGILGALVMGALLGIVAAPCVGPVVAALLVYVGAKANVALGFLLFFVLSLGLGLPYLVLGTLSGSIKSLPRSGAWMEKLKKVFAVLLVFAALYYGYLAYNGFRPKTAAPMRSEHWSAATLTAIQLAKEKGQPVVLDFRADWCLPCLKMEKEIFSQPKVLSTASKDKVQLLQVDLTRAQ